MNQYYFLVSQLPAFSTSSDEKSDLPITETYYRDLCSRFFTPKEKTLLDGLSLVPPLDETPTGSRFLDEWYTFERSLRLALAQVRAQRMHKDSSPLPGSCTADILQAARTAVGMDSPLSAEQYLYNYRMSVLGSISPIDIFSTDAVFAYGVKLLLAQRMKRFDREQGTAAYRTIYDSILGETT